MQWCNPLTLQPKMFLTYLIFCHRFVGCIEDLAYSKDETPVKPGSLLSAAKVASGCVDACAAKSTEHCANGGKCLNKFSKFVCNCLGTGYEGKNCSKRKYCFEQRRRFFHSF